MQVESLEGTEAIFSGWKRRQEVHIQEPSNGRLSARRSKVPTEGAVMFVGRLPQRCQEHRNKIYKPILHEEVHYLVYPNPNPHPKSDLTLILTLLSLSVTLALTLTSITTTLVQRGHKKKSPGPQKSKK